MLVYVSFLKFSLYSYEQVLCSFTDEETDETPSGSVTCPRLTKTGIQTTGHVHIGEKKVIIDSWYNQLS